VGNTRDPRHYVLDFSDTSFQQFIHNVCGIDINQKKYHKYGSSKGKRLKAFLEIEKDATAGKVIHAVVDHWSVYKTLNDEKQTNTELRLSQNVRKIADRLLGKVTSAQKKPTSPKSEEEFLKQEFDTLPIDKLKLDAGLVDVLKQRIDEIQKSLKSDASLSVIFLCGSTLEGILLGVATHHPKKFNQSKSSPKDSKFKKVLPLYEWSLNNLIDVAHQIGFIGLDVKNFSHALRGFRNYIHPYEQWSSNFHPDKYTARISWQVLQAAIHDLSKIR
jgi:hypothetical protein